MGAFVVLYWNEGRPDLLALAKMAKKIDSIAIADNKVFQGQLVSITGEFNSDEKVGDGLFLRPMFIAVNRLVEMYGWEEVIDEKTYKHIGGSDTIEKSYSYVKRWIMTDTLSRHFKYAEGHENPKPSILDASFKVRKVMIGKYNIDVSSDILPKFINLKLDAQNITLGKGATLCDDSRIFISKSGDSTIQDPQIGDLLLRYIVVPAGRTATILGKLDGDQISYYIDENSHQTLARIFWGTHNDAIYSIEREKSQILWLIRLLGFVMMFFGLFLILNPISVFLGVLPVLGDLSSAIIFFVTFFVALFLSIITILISMIVHSFFIFIIVLLACMTFGIFLLMRSKRIYFKNREINFKNNNSI